MNYLTLGILAHVDAGKTTLSESILYHTGVIRKVGRVDNQDTFLDTNHLEKERGITIFSKEAVFPLGEELTVTLLDTPGHVDFSPEAERTLQVLDAAVLLVSGADGVQGHTKTLFKLLEHHNIPTIIFVNKMDQPGTDPEALLAHLQTKLSDGCVSFAVQEGEEFLESIACNDEAVMEHYLEEGTVSEDQIRNLIASRTIFPVFFGSALKDMGIEALLAGMKRYLQAADRPQEFGARVYKITRDEAGNRLTHLKITGGSLKVRQILCDEEKITGIRILSGNKFENCQEAVAGQVCALTGLTKTRGGQGLGFETEGLQALLEPVMTYKVILPPETDNARMLPKLQELMEDLPELHVIWQEELSEIHVSIMGEVQLQILQKLIAERFGVEVQFGAGRIVYKETIANVVEGVGHFEPLRHYAEVHLLLEPGERGSGLHFASCASQDVLATNWQRLILTHLAERSHRGVLTGAPITDMKITVLTGRAHPKHTEGGDFRQATYRAIRQGLMQAGNVLLEPYYDFELEIPQQSVGRAMTDLNQRFAKFTGPEMDGEMAVISGYGPVSLLQEYQQEVVAYTGGRGRITCSLRGYDVCHNPEEVIGAKRYDPEADLRNSPDSVFCAHGAGVVVSWRDVFDHMHVPAQLSFDNMGQPVIAGHSGFAASGGYDDEEAFTAAAKQARSSALIREQARAEYFMGTEEIDTIIAGTSANKKSSKQEGRAGWNHAKSRVAGNLSTGSSSYTRVYKPAPAKEKYMLVDGYNVIHAWKELSELAGDNLDGARGRLLDILCNYQAIRKIKLIAVFDAYKVKGHYREIEDYHNIHVVYTKEAETADAYIEKFAHEHAKNYDITVVTSDGLEQIIILGAGCTLVSSREFEEEVRRMEEELKDKHIDSVPQKRITLADQLSEESLKVLMQSSHEAD